GFEYYEEEEYTKAQGLFELIINNLRGKIEAEKVYFYYSYTHYHLRRYVMASYYFGNFASTFPNSSFREEADFMAAYSNYQLSPSYRLDQTYSAKAIDQFQLFVNTYPTSERVAQCNDLIDEMRRKLEKKAFAEGELYYNLREYQAATQSFENLLKDFPESPDAEKVRFLILKGNFLLAENSILSKQGERYQNTIEYYDSFINKYPTSRYRKEADSMYKNSNNKLKELKDDRYQIQSARTRS
ncbi:MAG: outer membrane protein assembly factor BamD, partial [Bacteroidota bacterium]